MTQSNSAFFPFAWTLFWDVVKRPANVVIELDAFDAQRSLRFGWMCFFVSTVFTSVIQIVFASQVLEQLATDPQSYQALSTIFSSLASPEVFKERLELFVLINQINLFLSPITAWFFPHLLAGALFVILNFLAPSKAEPGTYDRVLKLVAIGQAPLLFCFIPFIGPIVGNLWSFVFVVRTMGSVFKINALGRLSAAFFCFFSLFSIWNSTMQLMAIAVQQSEWTWHI